MDVEKCVKNNVGNDVYGLNGVFGTQALLWTTGKHKTTLKIQSRGGKPQTMVKTYFLFTTPRYDAFFLTTSPAPLADKLRGLAQLNL